jgi:hypothetical protein
MPSQKFKVGQTIELAPAIARNMPGGIYKIIEQLPERNGGVEYRIKNINEPHERVVREIELLIIKRS